MRELGEKVRQTRKGMVGLQSGPRRVSKREGEEEGKQVVLVDDLGLFFFATRVFFANLDLFASVIRRIRYRQRTWGTAAALTATHRERETLLEEWRDEDKRRQDETVKEKRVELLLKTANSLSSLCFSGLLGSPTLTEPSR
jgi:hypothetical protein